MRAFVAACVLGSSSFFHQARKLSMTVACFQASSSALPSRVIGLSVKRQSKAKEGWVCARQIVDNDTITIKGASSTRISFPPVCIKQLMQCRCRQVSCRVGVSAHHERHGGRVRPPYWFSLSPVLRGEGWGEGTNA